MSIRRILPLVLSGLVLLLASTGVAPRPARAQAGNVEILISSLYRARTDSLDVVGEVVNHSGATASFAKIVVSYRDGNGVLITTDFTYTARDSLLPNKSSPIDVLTIKPPEGIASYDGFVEYRASRAAPLRAFDLTIGDLRRSSTGSLRITGELRNSTGVEAKFVKVIAALYDENNTVIRVDFTYSERDQIRPSKRSPFEVLILDAPPFATYTLWVEGRPVG